MGKVSRAESSSGLTTGPGEAATELSEGVAVPFLSSANCQQRIARIETRRAIDHTAIPPVSRLVLLRGWCLQLDLASWLVLVCFLGRNLNGRIVVTRDRGWLS